MTCGSFFEEILMRKEFWNPFLWFVWRLLVRRSVIQVLSDFVLYTDCQVYIELLCALFVIGSPVGFFLWPNEGDINTNPVVQLRCVILLE